MEWCMRCMQVCNCWGYLDVHARIQMCFVCLFIFDEASHFGGNSMHRYVDDWYDCVWWHPCFYKNILLCIRCIITHFLCTFSFWVGLMHVCAYERAYTDCVCFEIGLPFESESPLDTHVNGFWVYEDANGVDFHYRGDQWKLDFEVLIFGNMIWVLGYWESFDSSKLDNLKTQCLGLHY